MGLKSFSFAEGEFAKYLRRYYIVTCILVPANDIIVASILLCTIASSYHHPCCWTRRYTVDFQAWGVADIVRKGGEAQFHKGRREPFL